MTPIPELAKSWTVNEDATDLRDDVYWVHCAPERWQLWLMRTATPV